MRQTAGVAVPTSSHQKGLSRRGTTQPIFRFAGEQFVVQFEHWRLNQLGFLLADRVNHVSQTKGDGLGNDVLSFESDGRERFIEVKTTSFARETPFFVTKGELALSPRCERPIPFCIDCSSFGNRRVYLTR